MARLIGLASTARPAPKLRNWRNTGARPLHLATSSGPRSLLSGLAFPAPSIDRAPSFDGRLGAAIGERGHQRADDTSRFHVYARRHAAPYRPAERRSDLPRRVHGLAMATETFEEAVERNVAEFSAIG